MSSSLLLYWNIGCAVCVFLPLLVLTLNRLFLRLGEGGEGGAEDWGWGDNAEDREFTIVFAYVWTLLLFLVLAFYGNSVLSDRSGDTSKWYKPFHDVTSGARSRGILTGATLVFANLAFVLFFVVCASVIDWDRPQGEGIWESSMFVPLTFLLWTLFGGIFGVLLYFRSGNTESDPVEQPRRDNREKQRSNRGSGPFLACGRDTTID